MGNGLWIRDDAQISSSKYNFVQFIPQKEHLALPVNSLLGTAYFFRSTLSPGNVTVRHPSKHYNVPIISCSLMIPNPSLAKKIDRP